MFFFVCVEDESTPKNLIRSEEGPVCVALESVRKMSPTPCGPPKISKNVILAVLVPKMLEKCPKNVFFPWWSQKCPISVPVFVQNVFQKCQIISPCWSQTMSETCFSLRVGPKSPKHVPYWFVGLDVVQTSVQNIFSTCGFGWGLKCPTSSGVPRLSKSFEKMFFPWSGTDMSGQPGCWTMEMNGGSSASYLARTPCVP